MSTESVSNMERPPVSSPTDDRIIHAPWTVWQVADLNRYQRAEIMHPFTCPNPEREHDDVDVVLLATPEGWFCPVRACCYTQDWAHAFMADPFLVSEHRILPEQWHG